jgi:hypothetical protein
MEAEDRTTLKFAYDRGLSPMMWVLFCIGLLETLVLHFVIAQIWPRFGIFLSLLSGSSVLWIFFIIRSLKTHPVLLSDGRLVMRCGTLKSIDIAVDTIVGMRKEWPSGALNANGILNLSLIAYPNIIIDVHPPIISYRFRRERRIHAVAHRFDDLPAFVAALSRQRNSD